MTHDTASSNFSTRYIESRSGWHSLVEWHLGSEHIDCDIDSGFQFKLVLAGSEQDGLLVVVTIVVMNSPHVGCTMGHVKLQALSSSEC